MCLGVGIALRGIPGLRGQWGGTVRKTLWGSFTAKRFLEVLVEADFNCFSSGL